MLPSPYDTHEPIQGLPAFMLPVWMKVIAGSWLIASVCIDRTIAKSSTIFAIFGSNSDTHAPFFPCCANLNFEGAIGNRLWPDVIVVNRCPCRIDAGRSLSNQSFIFGL